MLLKVISECVDQRTRKRYFPGSGPDGFFPESDAEQVERLIRAGCLKKVSAKDLEADERSAAAMSRETAASAIAEIEKTLTEARARRDAELLEISNEIGRKRRDADDEIARIDAELEEKRKAAAIGEAGAPLDPAEISRRQLNEDGLFEMTVPELKEIASSEGVEIPASARKEDIVAAIRAKRAEKPAS